jgi:branched-chain amino acid transport system ATP-binding protein
VCKKPILGRWQAVLEVTDLHAYYGKSHILQGVNFSVQEGEIISLLGHNGVGKSTTVKVIMGEVSPTGSIKFKGNEIAGKESFEIAKLGIGYVPENRDIFPTLTVRQNLLLGMKSAKTPGRWTIEELFTMFPNLRERADVAGGVLSGGEQQMLSMCRTLIGDPELIMIDEPTEGLAPKLVEQVADLLQLIASRGVAILLVEQKLSIAMKISQRLYVMGRGQIVYEGTPESLQQAEDVRAEWLEV